MSRWATDEVINYIRKLSDDYTAEEIAKKVSEKIKRNITKWQVQGVRQRNNIKSNYGRLLTEEQHKFLLKNYKGIGNLELATLMNETFGLELTALQINGYKANRGLDSGMTGHFEKGRTPFNKGMKQEEYMSKEVIERTKATRFKKGQKPINLEPLGTERVSVDGYVFIKAREGRENNYVPKHRYVWEKHYGEELSADEALVFLDRDKTNCSIENLRKIRRADLARLNQNKLLTDDPELNEAALVTAQILAKRGELSK